VRKDKFLKDFEHDPYSESRKLQEGTFCKECGAVYVKGRWTWPFEELEGKTPSICPACRRIRDDYPAGEIVISGTYFLDHREEILNIVYNVLEQEKERSPLKRVIKVEEGKGFMRMSFTDDHLVRRIGEALYRAHKGTLELQYAEGDKFLRIQWKRDK